MNPRSASGGQSGVLNAPKEGFWLGSGQAGDVPNVLIKGKSTVVPDVDFRRKLNSGWL
jgi:hypothetical protein